MLRTTTVITLVCLGAAMGCQKKEKPELATVPPPVEPVEVRPYEAQEVQFEEVTPVEPQPAIVAPVPVDPPAAHTTYTIKRGDSLWRIAKDHYGDGNRWTDIVEANPGLEPKKLHIGSTIILP